VRKLAVGRQRVLEYSYAAAPVTAGNEGIDGPKVEELEALGLLECPGESVTTHDSGKVEQGAGDAGDGDALNRGPVVGVEIANEVDCDAGAATVIALPSGHVDQSAVACPDGPQRCCAVMAKERVRTKSKYSGEKPTGLGDLRAPDCVDASVNPVQSPSSQPGLNPRPTEPNLHELRMCHEAVLATCYLGYQLIT
jgi:hypothetical protein